MEEAVKKLVEAIEAHNNSCAEYRENGSVFNEIGVASNRETLLLGVMDFAEAVKKDIVKEFRPGGLFHQMETLSKD